MGRRHVSPFKASAKSRKQYKQVAGVLTAPLKALAKGSKKGTKKRRG